MLVQLVKRNRQHHNQCIDKEEEVSVLVAAGVLSFYWGFIGLEAVVLHLT